MVLQVGAHARDLSDLGDAVLAERRSSAQTGKQEEVRRVDGTCREQDFTAGC